MASIREKGTGKTRRFEVRYKDPTGRHRSKSFTTKTDAKGFLAQAISAEQRRDTLATHGLDLGPQRETTVGEWTAQWVATHDMDRQTRVKYASAVRAHLEGSDLAEKRLTLITPYDVEQHLGRVTSRTMRYTLYQALAMTMDSARRARLIKENVVREVSVPQPRRERKPRVLLPDELAALYAALPQPWRLMARLQLWTGARPGEAIAWQTRDLNLQTKKRSTIALIRAARRDGTLKPIKTDNEAGERILPLERDLVDELGALAAGRRPDELLFPSRSGTVLSTSNFTSRTWLPAVRQSGLDNVQWYHLRHTCASRLIERGADVIRVARWMGHSDERTTLRVYGHMFPRGLDDLADLIDP